MQLALVVIEQPDIHALASGSLSGKLRHLAREPLHISRQQGDRLADFAGDAKLLLAASKVLLGATLGRFKTGNIMNEPDAAQNPPVAGPERSCLALEAKPTPSFEFVV